MAKTALGAASALWMETTERVTGVRDRVPVTYDVTVVRIPAYIDLGVRGSLTLQFLNNQLSAVWFFPSEWHAYLIAMESQRGVRLTPGKPALLGQNLRLTSDPEQRCVTWTDHELDVAFRRAVS